MTARIPLAKSLPSMRPLVKTPLRKVVSAATSVPCTGTSVTLSWIYILYKVGTSYFDAVTTTIQGSQASTTALKNSTEDEQFFDKPAKLHVANG